MAIAFNSAVNAFFDRWLLGLTKAVDLEMKGWVDSGNLDNTGVAGRISNRHIVSRGWCGPIGVGS
jgi:hypothetical protein